MRPPPASGRLASAAALPAGLWSARQTHSLLGLFFSFRIDVSLVAMQPDRVRARRFASLRDRSGGPESLRTFGANHSRRRVARQPRQACVMATRSTSMVPARSRHTLATRIHVRHARARKVLVLRAFLECIAGDAGCIAGDRRVVGLSPARPSARTRRSSRERIRGRGVDSRKNRD